MWIGQFRVLLLLYLVGTADAVRQTDHISANVKQPVRHTHMGGPSSDDSSSANTAQSTVKGFADAMRTVHSASDSLGSGINGKVGRATSGEVEIEVSRAGKLVDDRRKAAERADEDEDKNKEKDEVPAYQHWGPEGYGASVQDAFEVLGMANAESEDHVERLAARLHHVAKGVFMTRETAGSATSSLLDQQDMQSRTKEVIDLANEIVRESHVAPIENFGMFVCQRSEVAGYVDKAGAWALEDRACTGQDGYCSFKVKCSLRAMLMRRGVKDIEGNKQAINNMKGLITSRDDSAWPIRLGACETKAECEALEGDKKINENIRIPSELKANLGKVVNNEDNLYAVCFDDQDDCDGALWLPKHLHHCTGWYDKDASQETLDNLITALKGGLLSSSSITTRVLSSLDVKYKETAIKMAPTGRNVKDVCQSEVTRKKAYDVEAVDAPEKTAAERGLRSDGTCFNDAELRELQTPPKSSGNTSSGSHNESSGSGIVDALADALFPRWYIGYNPYCFAYYGPSYHPLSMWSFNSGGSGGFGGVRGGGYSPGLMLFDAFNGPGSGDFGIGGGNIFSGFGGNSGGGGDAGWMADVDPGVFVVVAIIAIVLLVIVLSVLIGVGIHHAWWKTGRVYTKSQKWQRLWQGIEHHVRKGGGHLTFDASIDTSKQRCMKKLEWGREWIPLSAVHA